MGLRITHFVCVLLLLWAPVTFAKKVSISNSTKRKVAQDLHNNTSGKLKTSLTNQNKQILAVYKGGQKLIDINIPDEFEYFDSILTDANDFVVYQISFGDFDSSAGKLIAIDKKTLHHNEWTLDGYNFSQPLISGDIAYLAFAGNILKVNLRSGEKLWSVSDLYRNYRFMGVPSNESIRKEGSILYYGKDFSYDEKTKVFRSKKRGEL